RSREIAYGHRRCRRGHDAAQGSAGDQTDSESFHGHLPIVAACRQEQTARYYLNRAGRRTARSPPTRRASSTPLTRIPFRDDYVPAVSRAYLSQKLTRPLPTKRRRHAAHNSRRVQIHGRDQRGARATSALAAGSRTDRPGSRVAAVSWKLPLAILKDAKFDVSKVSAK